MKWFSGPDKISTTPLGCFILPPPPVPLNIQGAQVLLMQIGDWAKNGDKEMEREMWKLLSDYANKQAERPIITKNGNG